MVFEKERDGTYSYTPFDFDFSQSRISFSSNEKGR